MHGERRDISVCAWYLCPILSTEKVSLCPIKMLRYCRTEKLSTVHVTGEASLWSFVAIIVVFVNQMCPRTVGSGDFLRRRQ